MARLHAQETGTALSGAPQSDFFNPFPQYPQIRNTARIIGYVNFTRKA